MSLPMQIFIFAAACVETLAVPVLRLRSQRVAEIAMKNISAEAAIVYGGSWRQDDARTLRRIEDNHSLDLLGGEAGGNLGCDQHIKKHPADIHCPGNCPYLRAEPTRLCEFKCVLASECTADNPLSSFANPETLRCEACHVAACSRCGESSKICAQCQAGYELISDGGSLDGTCLSQNRHYWRAAFIVLGCIAVVLVWYVLALLFIRPSVNDGVMEKGIQFRHHSIVRLPDASGKELVQVRLSNNLMREEGIVCGAGVMLHFRWMGAIFVWTIFALILFLIAGLVFHERIGIMKGTVISQRTFNACESNVRAQEEMFNDMESVYFACTLVLYLATFVGSLLFASFQCKAYYEQDVDNVTHKDFVLFASGFPISSGAEKVEEDVLRFLEEQPQFQGLDVVGVSVCWDVRAKQDEIAQQIRNEFDILGSKDDDIYRDQTLKAKDSARDSARDRSCAVDTKLTCIDKLFGFGQPCCRGEIQEEPEACCVKDMLEQLQTTGGLYVVLGSTNDQEAAHSRCHAEPMYYEKAGEKYQIEISATEAEPLAVLWNGYGTPNHEFMMSIYVGCAMVFFAVILLDICFYTPYVMYIISFMNVAGESQGGATQGILLGLLITVCNQAIYAIIQVAADRCGWTNADSKDCFYCVKYTLAVFFNTIVDLATVLILAQGYSVDQAMQHDISSDASMSAKAIAEGPNMQKAIYEQLVLYIWPSCTLLPFLIEPFATTFGPFVIGKALVRSRQEVTVQDAEECLQNPPYDLSRYGDVLINVMLCCIALLFTYRDLWELFFYLLISLTVIYAWDHVRVLRFTTKTMFSRATMDYAAMHMMGWAGGIIAACLVFKIYCATHHGFIDSLTHGPRGFEEVFNRHLILWYMMAAFVVHCIVHSALLTYVVVPVTNGIIQKRSHTQEEGTYAKVGAVRPDNYFNTNPTNCLRSKYIYKHDPPCVPYRIGKEQLLKKNEAIRLYFEARDKQSPRIKPAEGVHGKIDRLKHLGTGFFDGA